MGIKGTVRRSTDGHIIHANIDTDIIIAGEPVDGQYSTLIYLHVIKSYPPRKQNTHTHKK